MCFDLVEYAEFSCKHRVEIRRQTMDCNKRNCRLSQLHHRQNHDCAGCAQVMRPDEPLVVEERRGRCQFC